MVLLFRFKTGNVLPRLAMLRFTVRELCNWKVGKVWSLFSRQWAFYGNAPWNLYNIIMITDRLAPKEHNIPKSKTTSATCSATFFDWIGRARKIVSVDQSLTKGTGSVIALVSSSLHLPDDLSISTVCHGWRKRTHAESGIQRRREFE